MALAAGARQRGATIRTHTRVVGIGVERGRVTGVDRRANDGDRARRSRPTSSSTPAGCSRPRSARLAGVTVPIIPMAHQYLFTEAIEGVHPGLPQLRDPDNLVYFREEVGGLCMGGYERNPAPWSLDGIPPDFNGKLLAPDWPRFEEIMAGADPPGPGDRRRRRHPDHQRPEAFTPDNEFILGESEVRGFFVAAGFCAHGIAGRAASAARSRLDRRRRARARPVAHGHPSLRWPALRSRDWTLARTTEIYATYYDIHYPNEERQAGRPAADRARRTSGSRALGAVFGEKSGWERPNWFEPNADDPRLAVARRLERSGRAAGPASTGAPRSPRRRSRPAGRGALRRVELRQARGRRARRARLPGRMCANAVDRPESGGSSTPRCSTAGAGSSAT